MNALLLAVALITAGERPITIQSAAETLRRGANLEIAGERICGGEPVPLFYARRQFQPAWNERDRAALVDVLRRADEDGLNPKDYHIDAIQRLQKDPSRASEVDLLLTDAFFVMAAHLLAGRIDPLSIEPTWCLQPRTSDLVPALETALEIHEIPGTLDALRPAHPGYRQLRDALARYRQMREWQKIESGPALRAGDGGRRVDQLVARLIASGELAGMHTTFDANVLAAVQRFQHLHGLERDGIAGTKTIEELNVPLGKRIRQIELNLERWRWLPANLGARYVLINIPQFQLTVVEQGKPVLTMGIVVGKDFAHRTPVFSSEIKQIVFSPYWNVPDSIAAKELWPKARRDSGYLAREHIEVLSNGRLRQKPGPWNALGRIKFDLPNRYSVYLHDTPAKSLFARSVRTFSHGCMRIEKPVDFAAYLLPGWSREKIILESETGTEHVVAVPDPLPVHVLYWTTFVDEEGALHFAPDVYTRDAVLDEAMRKPVPRV